MTKPIPIVTPVLLALMCWAPLAAADPPRVHVFTYKHAERAVQVARDECRPLLLHFAPNKHWARKHRRQYYGPSGALSRELLSNFVVLILPRTVYPSLAHEMGVLQAGGIVVVSPYDFSPRFGGDVLVIAHSTWPHAGKPPTMSQAHRLEHDPRNRGRFSGEYTTEVVQFW